MADEVSGNDTDPHYNHWSIAFANLPYYLSLNDTITANYLPWSFSLLNGNNIYNTLTSEILKYYSNFNTITAYNNNWTNNISAISSLSGISTKTGNEVSSTYDTFIYESDKWDTTVLNTFSAENFPLWNSLYKTLSTDKKYSQWNRDITDFNLISTDIDKTHVKIDSTTNTLTASSGDWDTTVLNTFSAENFPLWNNYHDTLTGNYNAWNVTLLSSFTANYHKNSNEIFNTTYNTLTTSSGDWDTTVLNTFSAENFPLWNSALSTLNEKGYTWVNAVTTLSGLSTTYFDTISVYDSLHNTVTSNSSNAWDRTIIQQISSYLPKWDSIYHVLIDKNENTELWDNTFTLIEAFSSSYIQDTNRFASTSTTVVDYNVIWSNKGLSTGLSGNSAKWNNVYNLLTATSSKYSFNDRESTIGLYTTIDSNSAKWNSLNGYIGNNDSNWTGKFVTLTGLSSQALTGDLAVTMSANDIAIYGTTYIAGNLSALGKKITIDTSVATTSSFIINNEGTTDAMVVNKTGGFDNAILNLNLATPTLTSTVLYVKTTNSVGVNLSSFDTTTALTVSGNISASGFIYPLDNVVTTFSSNSSKYTSTFSTLTSLSTEYILLTSVSGSFSSSLDYVNLSSTIIKELTANNPKLSSAFTLQKTVSNYNDSVNNHVTLCAASYGLDTYFRSNKTNLDTFYDNTTSLSASTRPYNINILFSYNKDLSANKIKYIVEDNIRINGWLMTATSASEVTVDILSSDYNTYGNGIIINKTTGGLTVNQPRLDSTDNIKKFSTGLNLWRIRNIRKDSILEFNMDNKSKNTNTEILLILDVSKQ
jgi:hypothetical protein